MLEQVGTGALDAGFCLGDTGAAQELASLQLALPVYRIVGPAQWADKIGTADWAALAAMPWVGTPRRSSQHYLTSMIERQPRPHHSTSSSRPTRSPR